MEEEFRGKDKAEPVLEEERHNIEFSNDADVDKVVDQIVNEESDKLLQAEDEARERKFTPPKKTFKQKIKHIFVAWWSNRRFRYGTIFGLLIAIIIASFVPYTRYGILNLAGVRVRASINIVDVVSGRPLKNIPVNLQGHEQRTNDDGYVEFSGLKQGSTLLKDDKRGYAPFEKNITL